MKPEAVTRAVILATLAFLALYDAAVCLRYGPVASISRVVLRWSDEYRILVVPISLAAGALVGHFLLPQRVR
jgi:hypothetical protein